jgi:hypothetical protein
MIYTAEIPRDTQSFFKILDCAYSARKQSSLGTVSVQLRVLTPKVSIFSSLRIFGLALRISVLQ